MASNNSSKPPEINSADQAIRRALEAEGEVRAAISECEQAAHTLLLDARQRARRIHDRTDQRISSMKMKAAQRVSVALRQLEQEQTRLLQQKSTEPLDETGLTECIEQVACLLSGGTLPPDNGGEPQQ